MKIFRFNIGRAAKVQVQRAPNSLAWLRGDDLEAGSVLSNAYQQVVWVYRAINVLAEQVANVPFVFSRGERGGENLITSGPLNDFYVRPHPQINRFQYWELRVIWLMLRGECVRVPIYDKLSTGRMAVLRRVLMLDPAHFQHIIEDHQLIGWRYTGWGPRTPLAGQVFLPEEVWFEKLPNPFDFWRGLPPLYAAATAARTDFAASAFMRGVIENNADTGVIVRTDRPLAPEQEEQLFAALRERKRRAGIADRPVLLSGCAEVIKPQLSSSDLQFLENRKFSRGEICAAFGVPEEIVTTTDTAKYDVMQGARLNFIENRVAPLCGRLEAEEAQTVRALDAEAVGWFDLDSLPLMQQARRERLVAAKTAFEMGVPFNELNRVLDLGFRSLPWGDTGYVSNKLRETGAEKAPAQSSPTPPTDPGTAVSVPERAAQFLKDLSVPHRISSLAFFRESVKAKSGKLRKFFFEQRGRVLGRLANGDPVALVPLLEPESENGELLARMQSLLTADIIFGFQQALRMKGPEAVTLSDKVLNGLWAAQAARLKHINQNTLAALSAVPREEAVSLGARERLAERLKVIFNQVAEQADEIALVETVVAINAG